MKIICKHEYRGVKTSPDKPNAITKLIYDAKLFRKQRAINALAKIAVCDLESYVKSNPVDLICAAPNMNHATNMPKDVAQLVADEMKIPFKHLFVDKFNIYAKLTGKNILVIDDAIYTGKTANHCARALVNAGAQNVVFFAFAQSKSFINKSQ